MKRLLILLSATLLGCGCSSKETPVPEWPWTEPATPEEPQPAADPNPGLPEKGWTNVSASYSGLPDGIQLYKGPGTLQGVKAVAYVAVADLSMVTWDVWSIDDPRTEGTSEALKTPAEVFEATKAPVVMNGGYFFVEDGRRYNASVAVSAGRTYGVNLNYASLDWSTYYYPTRGVFYEKDGKLEAPDAQFPEKASVFSPTTAIGAGPVLIHGGKVVDSWKAELFYGNGSDDKMPEARHPRTAIGCSDGRLFLFVCEGRGMTEGVAGLTTGEVARVLLDLGCTEALNLDGGGSTCLLVDGKSTVRESDGSQRPVGSTIMLKKK